ncbi:unnamed protein product [Aphanomyces euteiches]
MPSLLCSCFSNENDSYLLYEAILAQLEDHLTRTDPPSTLRADLREHQANYLNVMQPYEWQNLFADAYAAHIWDLRYLVRASEVFQREDSDWAALCKLLQFALKNGTHPTNSTVDDTIRTCLQTRLMRSSVFAQSNSFLNPSSIFSPEAHAAPTQPPPAPAPGLELAPPPAPQAVPPHAYPTCHSYTGHRPICYYCGVHGHNSNHCTTLLAHDMREPKCTNVGFDPDIFHRTGKRLLEQEQRRSRRSRQSAPRSTPRDNRDPPPGGAGGSYYLSSHDPSGNRYYRDRGHDPSSNRYYRDRGHDPSSNRYYRDRSHDRGYGCGKCSSSSHAGDSHGAPPANTASALATYPAPLPPYVPSPASSAPFALPQQDPTPSFFDSGSQSPYWPQSTPLGLTNSRWTLSPASSTSSRLIPPKRRSDFEGNIFNKARED